jgi:hypothetical protein
LRATARRAALEAVAAIRTIEAEETEPTSVLLMSHLDQGCYRFGMARARRARRRMRRLDLTDTEPRAGRNWTDNGGARDQRGLKHRSADDVRIPPGLCRS